MSTANNNFSRNPAPHIHCGMTIRNSMLCVLAALVPAGAAGAYYFGTRAVSIVLACALSSAVFEFASASLRGQPSSITNFSAILTGVLLAFNLPPTVPLWIPVLGSFFAIIIAKECFGGIGCNIFNPAHAARAFLLAAYPQIMTTWKSFYTVDAYTFATPLGVMKEHGYSTLLSLHGTKTAMYWDLFIGHRGGSLGETCAAAILAGAVFLLWKRIITWHIPAAFLAALALFTWIFGADNGSFHGDPLLSVLSGGALIGAFFMATDWVTSPMTKPGMLIFGAGCGLITGIIRKWGGYPEGVCYSILIMNMCTPLIDRFIKPRRYGS